MNLLKDKSHNWMKSAIQLVDNQEQEISSVGLYDSGLHEYLQNKFIVSDQLQKNRTNNDNDSKSYEIWEKYINDSRVTGAFELLKKCYPQLNFPIKNDINKTEEYITAVLKGKNTNLFSTAGIGLNNAEGIKIILYESLAGNIPVLIVPDDTDFVKIIQSLGHRNNPVSIPDSMGAAFVNGINNWDKLNTLKNTWMNINPFGNWSQEFNRNIKPNPSLFQDGLVILSTKSYSNISAKDLELSEELWQKYSLIIRLEHECTHLFTFRTFGVMNNNLHDELIADYMGICKAFGRFNKNWLLQFMGLENYPVYRKGARLENYIKNAAISEASFEQLIALIYNAIENIFKFDQYLGNAQSDSDKQNRIICLCNTNLLEIASEDGAKILVENYHTNLGLK